MEARRRLLCRCFGGRRDFATLEMAGHRGFAEQPAAKIALSQGRFLLCRGFFMLGSFLFGCRFGGECQGFLSIRGHVQSSRWGVSVWLCKHFITTRAVLSARFLRTPEKRPSAKSQSMASFF